MDGEIMFIIPYRYSKSDDKVTSYKLNLNGFNIMFDFGRDDFRREDVEDVDYIFISHAHKDHWYGLYNSYGYLKKTCKIYATETTKRLTLAMVEDWINGETVSKVSKKEIIKLFEGINHVYFEETINCDTFKATFYPSGHMFGAGMILIESQKGNFLYTGDMDYVPNKGYRSYHFDKSKIIDFVIIDGTKLYNDTFKKEGISQISKYIEQSKDSTFYLKVVDKSKAPIIAFQLADYERLNHFKIVYDTDLININTILYEQGYDIYRHKKIIPYSQYTKGERIILLTGSDKHRKVKPIDFKLGLHISSDDINEFIYRYCPKAKVLIGHFSNLYLNFLETKYQHFIFLENLKKVELVKGG